MDGAIIDPGPVLVLGASGKTGRRVARRLQSLGVKIRAGSRSGQPRFDWNDASTWAGALAGARSAYVAFQPDLAMPGALEIVRAFFAQAVGSGVKRLVLLSGRGEAEALQAEEALEASGAEWTILRCSWFSQNFSENFLVDLIRAGEVALPVTAVGEPFVDADDIAEAAVVALTRPGHVGQLYELTGPRSLSFPQAVEMIGRAVGREIAYVPISATEFRNGLVQAQVPEPEADLVAYLFATVLDGRNEQPTDGVQRILGRPARDFADYVRRTSATDAWKV